MPEKPLPGIYAVQDEVNATVIHAIIVGPFETPYEGGFFYFILNCPDDYPLHPPKVKLMTTGGGRVRMNPNCKLLIYTFINISYLFHSFIVYANGKVCLSILGTWKGPR